MPTSCADELRPFSSPQLPAEVNSSSSGAGEQLPAKTLQEEEERAAAHQGRDAEMHQGFFCAAIPSSERCASPEATGAAPSDEGAGISLAEPFAGSGLGLGAAPWWFPCQLCHCSADAPLQHPSACPLLHSCLLPALPSLALLLGDPSFPPGLAFARLSTRLAILLLKSLQSRRKNNCLFHLAKMQDHKLAHQLQQGQEVPGKGRRHLLLPEEQISLPLVSTSPP